MGNSTSSDAVGTNGGLSIAFTPSDSVDIDTSLKGSTIIRITRDDEGSAGFRFDPATLTIKQVDTRNIGMKVGSKIVGVDGKPVGTAKEYLSAAKPRRSFSIHLMIPSLSPSSLSPSSLTTSATPASSNTNTGPPPVWEWKDNSRWKPFSAVDTVKIEAAYATKGSLTLYPLPGRAYVVNTSRMTQTNQRTNFSRPIRRTVGGVPTIGAGSSPSLFPSRGLGTWNLFGTNTTTTSPMQTHVSRTTPSRPGAPLPRTNVTFTSIGREHLDVEKVTGWQKISPPDYDPVKDTDPITFEPLGDGTKVEVVELKCSTPQLPCVYTKASVVQLIQNGASKCAVCNSRFSIPGPQPSGTMRLSLNSSSKCTGFPGCGSIVLNYNFPGGTQGRQHYHPGNKYAGTSRTAYLPDNEKGREAMGLLIKAFEAGILFRVGQSITTGNHDQTVWGGVHQKTSLTGGTAAHGWPDPGYFTRLTSECAAFGVFSDKWEDERKEEMRKYRLARQLSAQRKKQDEANDDDTNAASKDDDKSKGDTIASSSTVDTDIDAERRALELRRDHIQKELRDAMLSQDRKAIMKLMAERREIGTKLKNLIASKVESRDATPNAIPDSTTTDVGQTDAARELESIQKALQDAMRAQDRNKIVALMKKRAELKRKMDSRAMETIDTSIVDGPNPTTIERDDKKDGNDEKKLRASLEKVRRNLEEVQRHLTDAMATQNRTRIRKLMGTRNALALELNGLEKRIGC